MCVCGGMRSRGCPVWIFMVSMFACTGSLQTPPPPPSPPSPFSPGFLLAPLLPRPPPGKSDLCRPGQQSRFSLPAPTRSKALAALPSENFGASGPCAARCSLGPRINRGLAGDMRGIQGSSCDPASSSSSSSSCISGGGGGSGRDDVTWNILVQDARHAGHNLRLADQGDMEELCRLQDLFRKSLLGAEDSRGSATVQDSLLGEMHEAVLQNSYEPPHVLVLSSSPRTRGAMTGEDVVFAGGSQRQEVLGKVDAQVGPSLKGYIYSTVEEWFGNQSLYIAELLVDGESRGQGMGSLLTCASLHLALGRGNISCSHLCVGEHQRNAARIYEGRFGYRKLPGGAGAAMDDLELSDCASGISNFLEQLGSSSCA